MSWRKNFVYVFITYLLLFAGIGSFYYNFQTERLIHSRLLVYFRWIHNIFLIICFASHFPELIQIVQMFPVESELISKCNYFLSLVVIIFEIGCIYSTQRWHHSFFKLLDQLLKMEKLTLPRAYYYAERMKRLYLKWILIVRLAIFGFNTIISIMWAWLGNGTLIFQLANMLLTVFCDSIILLHFTLIWLICNIFFKLLFNLNQLFLDPLPMPAQFHKLLEIQRMYGKLIRMIAKIGQVFKYPVLDSVLYLICHSCLSGYLNIRIFIKETSEMSTTIVLTIYSLNDFLNFLLLASVAQTVGELREETFVILRRNTEHLILVERSVSGCHCSITFQYVNDMIPISGGLVCFAAILAKHKHLCPGRFHSKSKSVLLDCNINFPSYYIFDPMRLRHFINNLDKKNILCLLRRTVINFNINSDKK